MFILQKMHALFDTTNKHTNYVHFGISTLIRK